LNYTNNNKNIVLALTLLCFSGRYCSAQQMPSQTPKTIPSVELRPTGTRSEVACMGFSGNGAFFFMGTLNSWVYLWRTDDWGQVVTIKPPSPQKAKPGEHQDEYPQLTACSIDPNGKTLALGGSWTTTIFALPLGNKVKELPSEASVLAYSPDGRRLAMGYGPVIELWETNTWNKIERIELGADKVSTLAFSSNGRLFAAGSNTGLLNVWNTERSSKPRILRPSEKYEVFSNTIVFGPDDHLLASAVWSHEPNASSISIWSVASGAHIVDLGDRHAPFRAVAFSPDGTILAAADSNGLVQFWTTTDWKKRCTFFVGLVSTAVYSPDGKWFATGGGGEGVSVWKNPPCQ
jgi:WD40 repeat protein